MTSAGSWWVYVIETEKGQFYTGITTDIERRWREHNAVASGAGSSKTVRPRGARFFRSQKPLRVVFREEFSNRSEASKREAAIKKMSHQQKLQLSHLR